MSRILVTGSEGTLGTKLVEELKGRGHEVFGLDLQHSSTPNSFRADISESRQVDRIFSDLKPDVCYALAAEFGRNNGEEYHEQLWKTNLIGNQNTIDACLKHEAHMVFASSSEAYGDTAEDGKALHEDILLTEVPNFHNNYALSKWANERQIQIAKKNHGLRATTLRFFNSYGPGEYYNNYRSVISLFVYRLMHHMPITVYEDYHRVFMFISDWARTVAGIADRTSYLESCVEEKATTINIGGEEYVSIETLVSKLQTLIPESRSVITLLPKEKANITNKRPDNTRAQVLLGHECRVNLDAGLPLTVEWQRRQYGVAA